MATLVNIKYPEHNGSNDFYGYSTLTYCSFATPKAARIHGVSLENLDLGLSVACSLKSVAALLGCIVFTQSALIYYSKRSILISRNYILRIALEITLRIALKFTLKNFHTQS